MAANGIVQTDRISLPGGLDWPAVWYRARTGLAAAVVFGIPFVLFYRLILWHFYVQGSFLLDTGQLASQIWHNSPALLLPPSLSDPATPEGQSFYAFHVAPILSLANLLSYALPVTMPEMFAGFTGLSHGLLALAMFWLLASGDFARSSGRLALSALAATAFAFNGLAIAIARFPHFELFGAACLLLFFVALSKQRWRLAIVPFLLALATREDVGLHAFGVLAVWLAIDRWRGEPFNLRLVSFAAAAFTYSLAALFWQYWAYPGPSRLAGVYLGDPIFAHLTWQLLADRLAGWPIVHAAILLPLAAAAIWAAHTRDPFILAPAIASLPWALLHLLAASPLAGWMVGYYGYPFVVALAWPVLAIAGKPVHQAAMCLTIVFLSLIVPAHDYNPGRIALPEAFLDAPSAAQRRSTDQAIAAIAAARPEAGRLMVDNSVAALAPRAFSRGEIAGWNEAPTDTFVFLEHGFDAERQTGLPNPSARFAVPGTSIRIITDRPEAVPRGIFSPD